MKPESSSTHVVESVDEWDVIDNSVEEEQRQLINISYTHRLKEVTLGILAAVFLFLFIVSAYCVAQRALHTAKAAAEAEETLCRGDGILYQVICSVDRSS